MRYLITAKNIVLDKISFYFLTLISMFVPKQEKVVYIFDYGFKKDNVWMLAKTLSDSGLYPNFEIYYYIGEDREDEGNIKFISSKWEAFKIRLKAKYVFHSYMEMRKMKPVRGQIILNTMHGSPLKRIGYMESTSKFNKIYKYNNAFTYILCQSTFFKDIVKESFDAKEEQCLILGYPRNDAIFQSTDTLNRLGLINDTKSTILWVPTWRRDILTKSNNDSNSEFPILNTNNIEKMNDFLKSKSTLLIIKPHPFQMDIELFKTTYSNIKIIKNSELLDNSVEFYSMFYDVDAILTDYSSVYFDFLLTDKPIGFTIDDIDSYNNKRGFVVDNPLDLMPGQKIYNIDDLFDFVKNLNEGNDSYISERRQVNKMSNKFLDGKSSLRVLERVIGKDYEK